MTQKAWESFKDSLLVFSDQIVLKGSKVKNQVLHYLGKYHKTITKKELL